MPDIITTDAPNTIVLPAYKSYIAKLSQSGANAPTAIVLENTLGGEVVWSRLSLGNYVGTLVGGFPTAKMFIPIFGYAGVNVPIGFNVPLDYFYNVYPSGGDDQIHVASYDAAYAPIEMSIYAEAQLFIPIEIRVYP